MVRARTLLWSALFSLALLGHLPSGHSAQVFVGSAFRAEAAMLAAGTRAAAISELQAIPVVSVINLSVSFVTPMSSGDAPDVESFRASAEKNAKGIWRLRAALAANPVTRHALASRGIPIDRIVGVDIYSNGSIRVYII